MSSELKSNLEGLAAIVGERSAALSPHEAERIVVEVQRKTAARTASIAGAAAAAVSLAIYAGVSLTFAAAGERGATTAVAPLPTALPAVDDGPVIVPDDVDAGAASGDAAPTLLSDTYAEVRANFPGASESFAAGYLDGFEAGRADGFAAGASGDDAPGPLPVSQGLARDGGTYDDGFQAGYELGLRDGFPDGVATRQRSETPEAEVVSEESGDTGDAGAPGQAKKDSKPDNPRQAKKDSKPDNPGKAKKDSKPDKPGKAK